MQTIERQNTGDVRRMLLAFALVLAAIVVATSVGLLLHSRSQASSDGTGVQGTGAVQSVGRQADPSRRLIEMNGTPSDGLTSSGATPWHHQ